MPDRFMPSPNPISPWTSNDPHRESPFWPILIMILTFYLKSTRTPLLFGAPISGICPPPFFKTSDSESIWCPKQIRILDNPVLLHIKREGFDGKTDFNLI